MDLEGALLVAPTDTANIEIDPRGTIVDFQALDGSGVDITNSSFTFARMSGAHIANIYLDNVDFSGAEFGGVTGDGVVMSGGKLNDVGMFGATLRNFTFEDVEFLRSNLRKAKFVNPTFFYTDWTGASLGDAIFENPQLSSVNISGASLCGSLVRYGGGQIYFPWRCASGLFGETFSHGTYFFSDNPPLDLYRLTPPILIRAGCARSDTGPPDELCTDEMISTSTLIPRSMRNPAR
jgi:hypothetical protein